MRRLLLLLVSVAAVAACQINTDPLPFQMGMTVTKTSAAPGDTIAVFVQAQGGRLLNMVVDYDDGNNDQFAIGGARSAQAVFPHAYTAAGTYRIRAKVTDASDGDKFDSLDVHIQ